MEYVWIGVILLLPLIVYSLVRVGSMAYFRSKWDYHTRVFNKLDRRFDTSPSEEKRRN